MNLPQNAYGIIPARYQSQRFPGKPLVDILGKPMFYRVYERAARCPDLKKIWLATDDHRIYRAAATLNVPAIMTDPNHPSGSDRIQEAAEILGLEDEAVIINIQGDEPALAPTLLSNLLAPFADPDIQVTTPARVMDAGQAQNPDRVKVVRATNGFALYFSRAKIPHARDKALEETPYLLHIGLYAYRFSALKRFTELPPCPLEKVEKLEQLRLLEAGIGIYVVLTDYQGVGVDRPEDVAAIVKQLKKESA